MRLIVCLEFDIEEDLARDGRPIVHSYRTEVIVRPYNYVRALWGLIGDALCLVGLSESTERVVLEENVSCRAWDEFTSALFWHKQKFFILPRRDSSVGRAAD